MLPIPLDPGALYDTKPDFTSINEGRFFTDEYLTHDYPVTASDIRWHVPGAPCTRPLQIAHLLEKADLLRRSSPLAVWIATGGNGTP